jgi:hypothetical protein
VALAREQAQARGVSGRNLYEGARTCALAATTVKEDPVLRERYADHAVELLRRAVAAGYAGESRLAPRTDDAFNPLRGREDFEQLLKQLEARAAAKNRGRK